MIKTPRAYQVDIVDRTSRSLAVNKAVILHAPTGAGKSIMIDMIVARCLSKEKTPLVLSESRKIYSQLVEECNGIEINSNVKEIIFEKGYCYVGMIQTLLKRPAMLVQLQELKSDLVIIIDECHISTSSKLIEYLPEALRIGLTATPFARTHRHLPKYYKDLVEGPQVDWLIQEGYLCTYRHIAPTDAETSLLELRNGEYTEESQDKVFGSQQVYDGLFEDLQTTPFKKCVIFVASKKQADKLNDQLLQAGYKSCKYYSDMENGAYELAKFTELDLANIIVTIRTLSKGWNYPPIDLVVLMHKTTSTSLYLQEIGRASRTCPGKNNFFICIDYANNWEQHGLYWDERDYAELWKETKRSNKKGDGAASMKTCFNCESLIATSSRICKYCDFEIPISEAELKQAERFDITERYNSMVGRKVSELGPQELANYAKLKNKKSFAIRIAKSHEQINPGFLLQFSASMGYKKSWLDHQSIPSERIEFTDITLR